MFYKNILKKISQTFNKVDGRLERNPHYYHGQSFNKFQIKTSDKTVELEMDEDMQKLLEAHLWQEVSLVGIYITETLFKVDHMQNYSEDFALPLDLAKKYDLHFFQSQINKGMYLQPSYDECAV